MHSITSYWWKLLTVLLVFYTLLAGLLHEVPRVAILNESIRNLYFHVPMWFGMIILLFISVIFSIRYLSYQKDNDDYYASEFARTGILLGILGMVTGMVWAKFTWGAYWNSDPKQNASAIGLLMYLAYLLLRVSMEDPDQKARISAVYNIFAFPVLIALLIVLPRLTDSLHPGSGGNPGFSTYDVEGNMLKVFYPSIIAWTLLGVWLTSIRVRIKKLENN